MKRIVLCFILLTINNILLIAQCFKIVGNNYRLKVGDTYTTTWCL